MKNHSIFCRIRFCGFMVALLYAQSIIAQSDTTEIITKARQLERATTSEKSFPLDETEEMKRLPDSLVQVEITTIHYFMDTLTRIISTPDSVAMQREEIIYTDSSDTRGHYVQAYAGLGYGSLGYRFNNLQGSTTGGFVSGLLQAQYAYFFHPNWGVGAGLWFTNYTSTAHLRGDYTWSRQTDTDLEQNYDHTAHINRWNERQTIYNLGIPLSIQYRKMFDEKPVGIFASVGLAPSFSLGTSYRVLEGDINHSGYYPAWDLTLSELHEFGTKDYRNDSHSKGVIAVRPQIAIFADLGALLPMTKQIDLFLGGYFHCALNDANNSTKTPLGWRDETFTFMDEYKSSYALNETSASHPWEVGVKVGVHWHYIAPDKHNIIDYFDYFTRRDTTVETLSRLDTIYTTRIDTLTRRHIVEAAKKVEKFNKIYFALSSYELTHEVQQYLSSIVSILNDVPDAKISIDGHASAEGQVEFNEILAYNRAQAVAQYLIQHGLDEERVIVLGHGSLIPNDENVNHELPLDRRVEVKVVMNQSQIQK